jgi:hypothetical protein
LKHLWQRKTFWLAILTVAAPLWLQSIGHGLSPAQIDTIAGLLADIGDEVSATFDGHGV